ncbi:MAG: serine/threonine protein kinase [Marvinbryantia sp.]|jgi:serine/threonine protein kinase
MTTALYHLRSGTLLDERYHIETVIGEGGFGITYLGYNIHQPDEKVAIKEFYWKECVQRDCTVSNTVTVFKETRRSEYEHHKKRFLKEARIIGDFSQEPGIVHIRDYFEENSTAYIVMDYLEGQTLKQYMSSREPLNAEQAFRLLLPLMDALQKVHERKTIHRDISPDNIIINNNGALTLIDFGAARELSLLSNETRSVILKGGYAPMEQYDGRGRLGPWTDVYALCGVLYYCITKHAPDDAFQRMLHDELKCPSELGISIAPALEKILMKGLSLDIDSRYQQIGDLSSAIREFIKETDPKEFLKKRCIHIASAFGILLFLGIAGFSYYQSHLAEFKFHGRKTIPFTFSANEGITDTEYAKDFSSIKEQLHILAGKENYLVESSDNRNASVLIAESVFTSLLADSEHLPVASITDFVNYFISLRGSVSINTIDLHPQDILSVEVKKGEITHVDRATLPVAASGDYYYLEFQVSDAIAEQVRQLSAAEKDLPINVCLNRIKNSSSYTSGSLNLFQVATVYDKTDYKTYMLVGSYEEKAFYELLAYKLTHLPNRTQTAVSHIPPAIWEDVTTSMIAGSYQKNVSNIPDPAVYLQYACSSYDYPMANGEWFNTVSDIKTLMDSLEIPYAFGLSSLCDRYFTLKISAEHFYPEMMDLLKETSVKISDLGGLSVYPAGSVSSDMPVFTESTAPSYHWEYTAQNSYEIENLKSQTTEALQHDRNTLYLTVGSKRYVIASAALREPVTDGTISFTDFYIDDRLEKRILLNYLNTMTTEITHNSDYRLQDLFFTDAAGVPTADYNPDDYRCFKDPYLNEIRQTIAQIDPAITVETLDDEISLDITLPYVPDEHFIEHFTQTAKEIILRCNLTSGYYRNIYFNIAQKYKSAGEDFFLQFSPIDYSCYLSVMMNGTFLENYSRDFQTVMETDSFYKVFADTEKYLQY